MIIKGFAVLYCNKTVYLCVYIQFGQSCREILKDRLKTYKVQWELGGISTTCKVTVREGWSCENLVLGKVRGGVKKISCNICIAKEIGFVQKVLS